MKTKMEEEFHGVETKLRGEIDDLGSRLRRSVEEKEAAQQEFALQVESLNAELSSLKDDHGKMLVQAEGVCLLTVLDALFLIIV